MKVINKIINMDKSFSQILLDYKSENSYVTYYKNQIDSLMAIKPSTEKFLKVNVFVIKNTGDTTYKNTIWLDEKYEVKK